jgi:hypothetical protein
MGERKIVRGGTRGSVFRAVAAERLRDAEVLLEQGRPGGAVYLAGYALECVLKWAVTRHECTPYLAADLEIHNSTSY